MIKALSIILILSLCACAEAQEELDNTFYCFSNAGNLPNAPEGLDAKAAFLKELGYDGWGGHYGEEDYMARRAALDKMGLEMPEIYWNLNIDKVGNWSCKEGLKDAIVDSKDRNLIVSLVVSAPAFQENQKEGDPWVVKAVQELADFASPYGVKVAVYPHVNVYCETLKHSVRLAKMAERDNVGAIFNLCHMLKAEGAEGWKEKLSFALPYLYMISLSGADAGNTKEMGWDRLIQALGEGSFDTYQLRYSGFVALFDGKSSKGWRSINSDHFPETSWQIKNNTLITNAPGGAEGESGGDIISTEKKTQSNGSAWNTRSSMTQTMNGCWKGR